MAQSRRFYVLVKEDWGWDITCVENDQRKALDIFNEAKKRTSVHYIEAMNIKIGSPNIQKCYRWDL